MSTAAAAPLSPEGTVAPQLHQHLRSQIISCELPPGQRISESDIATTYAVSRQPVREAFIKLSEERLVSILPQRGTFIRRISVAAALTARFVREAVEVDLVRRAAIRATPEDVAALHAQIERQRAAAENGDPAEFMHLDEAFHHMLATLADAPAVSEYLDGLNVPMNRIRNISARQFSPEKLIAQHADIVAAIEQDGAQAAEDAMRTHLQQLIRDLPRIVEAYPDYFEDTEALT